MLHIQYYISAPEGMDNNNDLKNVICIKNDMWYYKPFCGTDMMQLHLIVGCDICLWFHTLSNISHPSKLSHIPEQHYNLGQYEIHSHPAGWMMLERRWKPYFIAY